MSEQIRYPDQDRSLGELFKELVQEVTTLVRQEMALAKTEMSQKAGRMGKHIAFLAAGGAVAYAGLLALVAAAVLLLAQLGMTWWLAALLVGVVVAGVGGALVMSGLNALKHEDLSPRETMESLEEVKEDLRGTTRIRNRAAG
jgi:uncharacterized membrane protein YqjE